MFGRSALRADLTDLASTPGRVDHQPAFADVVRAGLFYINMLAGIERENGRGRMPVIGRRDENSGDVSILQQASHVGGSRRLLTVDRGVLGRGREALSINVAHVDDAHVLLR